MKAFVADGPLPDRDANEEKIGRRVQLVGAVLRPVTAQGAKALVACSGPDYCYGVASTLLHLIETGPSPVLTARPVSDANKWHSTPAGENSSALWCFRGSGSIRSG
ncbi:hypothetical protein ACFXPY_44510 [Streptomyces sp. NPDC059153]|uniref:hypothetical protein n=1 Tax=unclassified Streptomyces TaxID=2593676 RepID=UPI00368D4982